MGYLDSDPSLSGLFPVNRTKIVEGQPPVLQDILNRAAEEEEDQQGGGEEQEEEEEPQEEEEEEEEDVLEPPATSNNLIVDAPADDAEVEVDGPLTESPVASTRDVEQRDDQDDEEEQEKAALALEKVYRGHKVREELKASPPKSGSGREGGVKTKRTLVASPAKEIAAPVLEEKRDVESGKLVLNDAQLKNLASLIDKRLSAEFATREQALLEMQQTLSKMRMQINIQSNHWKAFKARNKGRLGKNPNNAEGEVKGEGSEPVVKERRKSVQERFNK